MGTYDSASIGLANPESINNASISFACWAVATELGGGNMFSVDYNTLWRWRVLSDGTTDFLDRGGTVRVIGSKVMTTYRWTHLAVTAGPAGIRVFMDGVLDNSTATAFGGGGTASSAAIGAGAGSGAGSDTWIGSFCDVRLWHRVLTDTEVWQLYDPATRWDLYWVPGRRVFFDVGAPPASTAYTYTYILN